MAQDFKKCKKFFWIFPYYSLLLKSYHIILKSEQKNRFQEIAHAIFGFDS